MLKRRKYQKERRRRLSEGDSVELQPASNSMSKPPLQSSGSLDSNTWEQVIIFLLYIIYGIRRDKKDRTNHGLTNISSSRGTIIMFDLSNLSHNFV